MQRRSSQSAVTHRVRKIDELMDRASEALVATHYFECEEVALAALRQAHAIHDFDRMARILMPLQEARRQKRLIAADAAVVTEVLKPDALIDLRPGSYLLKAPGCVGMDGRLLRDLANRERIPVNVVVHEPLTMTREWPVVAVGPVTVRVRVQPAISPAPSSDRPPATAKKRRGKAKAAAAEPGPAPSPDLLTPEWFLRTLDLLGLGAMRYADAPTATARVDQLMQCLETVPEHELLHQTFADTCRDAMKEDIKPTRAAPMFADDEGEGGEA